MNLKPLAQIAAAHSKAVTVLALMFVASSGYAAWLHEHDARVRAGTLATERIAEQDTIIARLKGRSDSLDVLRTAQSVALAKTDTIYVHDSSRTAQALPALARAVASLPDTLRTAKDTASAIAALPVIRQQSAATIAACTDLVQSCADYRLKAAALFRSDSLALQSRDSTIAAMIARDKAMSQLTAAEKVSRWGFDATAGVGTVHDRTGWHVGPGGLAGFSYRF